MNPLSSVQLNRHNLKHNIKEFRKLIHKDSNLVGVIKANAYGHGQNEIAKIIEPYIDCFQVDDYLELQKLRAVSYKRTLVLGYVAKNEIEDVIKLDGELTIYDTERLGIINTSAEKLNKIAYVHIKIDAELGRQGLLLPDLDTYLKQIKKYSHIKIASIYSHFSNIEDTTNLAHAKTQIALLDEAIRICKQNNLKDIDTHIEATSGILAFQNKSGHNMVRLGIGMYGLYPSSDLKRKWEKKLKLKPVLEWHTKVAQIKKLPKGFPVGYGCTYITKRPTTIAVIPQGYSDGFDRGLSNKGAVLIKGKKAPVLGRVAMNMFVVDITHIKGVHVEDQVTLLGIQHKQTISAEDIAKQIDTINYEITTRISPLLPRVIV